jgi:threonine dehydratase
MFTNDLVESVYASFKSHVVKTPCLFSPYLSSLTGARVYLKLENMQQTGSFKERGVLSFLMGSSPDVRHVVTASAGNHAQALALHAARLNIKATIFMPEGTSNTKVSSTQKLKATVELTGQSYDEAYTKAREYAESYNAEYVHAYNDRKVIIGQATVALEIYEQITKPDVIIVPVGGGGLISGMAQFVANLTPTATKIIGVQAEDFQSMAQALVKGTMNPGARKTIAEGIAVKKVGDLALEICEKTRPDFVAVSDQEIEHAIMMLVERQKIVTEGAGAAPVAALCKEEYRHSFDGKTVVVVISGGNIDISLLARLSAQALVESSRLCRMSLVIKDTPGSLSRLLQAVTKASGNIVDIYHERSFAHIRWNEVLVDLIVETKGEQHRDSMLSALLEEGYSVQMHKQENGRADP